MTAAQPTAREQRLHCALCANPVVLHRDGHKCIECGSTENLHVHHIEPMAKSSNNEPSNMVTLCKSCHSTAHQYPLCKSKKREHKQYIEGLQESAFFMQRGPQSFVLVLPPGAVEGSFPFEDRDYVKVRIEDGRVVVEKVE